MSGNLQVSCKQHTFKGGQPAQKPLGGGGGGGDEGLSDVKLWGFGTQRPRASFEGTWGGAGLDALRTAPGQGTAAARKRPQWKDAGAPLSKPQNPEPYTLNPEPGVAKVRRRLLASFARWPHVSGRKRVACQVSSRPEACLFGAWGGGGLGGFAFRSTRGFCLQGT